MIYFAKVRATDSALTFGGINGLPIFPVLAFETKAESSAHLDTIWDNGDGMNLIRVSASDVKKWIKEPCICAICHEVFDGRGYSHEDCAQTN